MFHRPARPLPPLSLGLALWPGHRPTISGTFYKLSHGQDTWSLSEPTPTLTNSILATVIDESRRPVSPGPSLFILFGFTYRSFSLHSFSYFPPVSILTNPHYLLHLVYSPHFFPFYFTLSPTHRRCHSLKPGCPLSGNRPLARCCPPSRTPHLRTSPTSFHRSCTNLARLYFSDSSPQFIASNTSANLQCGHELHLRRRYHAPKS